MMKSLASNGIAWEPRSLYLPETVIGSVAIE